MHTIVKAASYWPKEDKQINGIVTEGPEKDYCYMNT